MFTLSSMYVIVVLEPGASRFVLEPGSSKKRCGNVALLGAAVVGVCGGVLPGVCGGTFGIGAGFGGTALTGTTLTPAELLGAFAFGSVISCGL